MSTEYVAIIPSIYKPYTDECVAGCKLENLTVVDNTLDNLGVAASWNVGVRKMYETGADWTIIISASVRFGEPGGLDLVEHLAANPDAIAVEAGKYQSADTVYSGSWTQFDEDGNPIDGFGMHLIAFHRRAFDYIGLFDENFWPGYMEDTDFHLRMGHYHDRSYHWDAAPLWPRVPVEGRVAYIGHGADLGRAPIHCSGSGNGETQMEYYLRKWGGPPHSEWDHPFNDPANDLSYWPTPGRYLPHGT